MSDLDPVYTLLIEQAKNGDRDDAISLLKEFVQFSRKGEEVPAPLVAWSNVSPRGCILSAVRSKPQCGTE